MKLSEKEIIAGCKEQKPLAQSALYQQYSSRLMAICARYAYTSFEAEDIFQDAFVKVFKNIEQYKGEGSFEGWLKHIFVNTAINHFHKNKKHYHQSDSAEFSENFITEEDAVSQMSAAELTQIISQLPDGYRMVFNLYVVDGYTHKEIGELLGISEGTSKSQLAKGKAILKKIITKQRDKQYVTRT
ncbi:MAG: ECF RNA polymerase sigma factor SigW [candidate division WS2 bacterium]|uniref:ECF RNA polymerase sigma factor SigW n=1 Tax=Psychracetigena formicireducens TaxID=2986056 RepID=A0A9E2BI41_PSYF1|nr:ECF RNA polymerase sigma factor SigW [Candidatus Psychracetigena formicireducens]